ncbi:hypothetical protein [Bacillus cereus]
MFYSLNLERYFNSTGMTSFDESSKGNLDEFAKLSFPKKFLKENLYFKDVPFKLNLDTVSDNISLKNQMKIEMKRREINEIYILGACNNGNFSTKMDFYDKENLVLSKHIYFTDLMEENSFRDNIKFIEVPYVHSPRGKLSIKSSLWLEKVSLEKEILVDSLAFEENPFVHIFAVTLGGRK